MRSHSVLIFAALLTGCGNNGEGSSDSGGQQLGLTKTVTLTTDANNCLLSHNAEAEINYTIWNRQAKNLVWNCANYQGQDQRVEAFIKFDDGYMCMRFQDLIIGTPNCAMRAIVPAAITPSVKIVAHNVSGLIALGGGFYGASATTTIKNMGNITAFAIGTSFLAYPYSENDYHTIRALVVGESAVDSAALTKIDPNGGTTVRLEKGVSLGAPYGCCGDATTVTRSVP